jgi:hypothetical protein
MILSNLPRWELARVDEVRMVARESATKEPETHHALATSCQRIQRNGR